MRKRYVFGWGLVALAILLALGEWEVSFDFGEYAPAKNSQAIVIWALSLVVFVLTILLGSKLFRTAVKLYLDRESNREGSRIQSKLVVGALALSILPVIFLVFFSYDLLNRNFGKWFARPGRGIQLQLADTAVAIGDEVQSRADALAKWLSADPAVRAGSADFEKLCKENRIAELRLDDNNEQGHTFCSSKAGGDLFTARAPLGDQGTLVVRVSPRIDLAQRQRTIEGFVGEYDQLMANQRKIRTTYILFLAAIALFILFAATWIALLLARLISVPIAALLEAAGQVRRGNLAHRITVPANDEMATLVRAFNEMTQGLEDNSRELESRRRFTEAILESIPTGVVSLAADGRVQRVNRALHGLFPGGPVENAAHLHDLFPADLANEIRYLMKRARRTGLAASQIDLEQQGQVMHMAVTVSALPAREPAEAGYVVVLEDTSELLRAHKAAAWHEVARRIAHELKNPLTPIALSAERIARILQRGPLSPEAMRSLRQSSDIISREVESVKTLADEFSQFSRFPAAQPVPSDLNAAIHNGLDVFAGRLEGIDLRLDLASDLPLVNLDPEQFKRVVVNLVDNAAEAMRDSMVKRLLIVTRASSDTVELLVADTGRGVSAGDKEKLFLPYFSTKGRGTGLGLAIVSHIVSEHGGRIRVEDNRPAGARFYIEMQAASVPEPTASESEVRV